LLAGVSAALVAGVVVTVIVLLLDEPERLSCAALKEHVGGSVAAPAPLYVTEQVKLTVPVKPATGVSVTAVLPDPPGDATVSAFVPKPTV
jgi:hypothetical protein